MGIISWAIVGLVVGALARFVVPGNQRLGCLGTIAVGVLGALVGGALASAAGIGEIDDASSLGALGISVAGAVLLLLVLEAIRGRGGRDRR